MPRWNEDEVDVACTAWAWQWVQHFARSPEIASHHVGPVGSTLGRVRQMGDGAASRTGYTREFPEVFLGQGLLVATTLKTLPASKREIIWQHYVGRCYDPATWRPLRRPTKQHLIAERLGISLAAYYQRRDSAKACIQTALTLDTKVLLKARSEMVNSGKVELPRNSPE